MKKYYLAALMFLSTAVLMADRKITAYHQQTLGYVEYNRHGVAHIITEDGWLGIDKKGKVLYKPFLYDNGPDYVKEGLLRFVENGKMGFVNEAGKKIIPAKFDFVEPFENGTAVFCNGCIEIQDGEHSMMDRNTGVWGEIDKKGRIQKNKKPAP